jgi:hypothetical protein
MHDPYTSPFFHSDRKRNFQCRIYTEVDNGNAGSRGRGGTRKRYGIIQRAEINTITAQRLRVTFLKRGSWIAQTQGPCGDALMECAGRTQLDALIRLGAWCADEWNRDAQAEPRRCHHCDRECEPGRFVCLDSDCPRFD